MMLKVLSLSIIIFSFSNIYSQTLPQINSIEEAENYIQSNEKAQITTLEISADSLDYYKNRFLDKDLKDKNRIVKIEPVVAMRVSYIYLDGSKLSLTEINKKRKDIIKLYKTGTTFRDLAATYTMDSGNLNGGDLDWFNEGVMHKTFEDAIKSHKKNDLFQVDIPENKWYYVVLKTYDDRPKATIYILTLVD
jgi:parvulin-like peptidyl-prolyl isomerase